MTGLVKKSEISPILLDFAKVAETKEFLILNGDERNLSIRAFTDNMRREAYERQNGICPKCKEHFEITEMEADHITPWSQDGKTIAENCQMLCRDCNRKKSDI